MEVASLDFSRVDPPSPMSVRVGLDRCFWWTDDGRNVRIAMERRQPVPLGPAWAFRLQLVLTLEEPPAGRAREYRVTGHTLRGRAKLGPLHARYGSLAGVVALYRERGDHLRGSFRLHATRQVQQALGGWSQPGHFLFAGTFDAVHDERRGRALAAEIESPATDEALSASPSTSP